MSFGFFSRVGVNLIPDPVTGSYLLFGSWLLLMAFMVWITSMDNHEVEVYFDLFDLDL